jgi:hypothetical protein
MKRKIAILLGAFEKLHQGTISFVIVRVCVFTEQLGLHWMDFHEISLSVFFENLTLKFY